MSYIEQMMENSMRDNENLSFNLSNSTILVRLTTYGEEIIKRLDPTGAFKKNKMVYLLKIDKV
ncbi:MAG: hypothetical protein E7163_04075 [Firmicutes bacterium]|nr:hypothetical protein [Bacillota bacterium]